MKADEKNYMTAQGFARLQAELVELVQKERPKIVELVHWAASNGDRSENGDYLYGKKRLREIDKRVRFLSKRLEIAQIVDSSVHRGKDQVFFGATVTYACIDEASTNSILENTHTVTILGIDESDSQKQQISWISPLAKALLKAHIGDTVEVRTPEGIQKLEVVNVQY